MSEKTMKVPGPDHPITVAHNAHRVIVRSGTNVIADSRDALSLVEAAYGPVHYIPRKDVDMTLLERSTRTSYCPFKGDASYFNVPLLGARAANAVWSYEAPYDAVASIAGHLAFYADRVEIVEEPAAA